jgi:hypothetical protein
MAENPRPVDVSTGGQRQATQDIEGPDIEYKYIVHIRAFETFRNKIGSVGVRIPETSSHVSFTSSRRLDLRAYRDKRIIWSYSIIKVTRNEEVVEEG